jgi:Spy/CpxP family protein refolding chaperone
MNRSMKRGITRALGVTLLALAVATPLQQAMAQDGPPHCGHGRHGGPFLHELHGLNLSDAQRQAIHGYVQASFQNARSEMQNLRSLRHAFDTAAPGSAGYSTAVAQLADAETKAAGDRVQAMAALRTQIYSVLTDAQKSQLAAKLASLPPPPPPREPPPQ